MAKQEKIDKKLLETEIDNLQIILKRVSNTELLAKIIRDIYGPGWTTPAEFFLFQRLIRISISQATQLEETLNSVELSNKAIIAG